MTELQQQTKDKWYMKTKQKNPLTVLFMLHMYKKALKMQNHLYRHCAPHVLFPSTVNIHLPTVNFNLHLSLCSWKGVIVELLSKICTQERFCTHIFTQAALKESNS